jgi:hypothetical protein
MTSETSTNISDNVSTVTTLVENSTIDNVSNSPTSNAIPIPKNQKSLDEQKIKHSSSFRSWWSSSSSSIPPYNQKDTVINNNNNNSMEEKQKTSNLIKYDKQFLRHDNGSSVSILTPINEDSPNERQRENMENVTTLVGKASDSKISSSYSSNSSTTSSRAWWMFGVGNHNNSREDVSSSNTTSNDTTTKPEMVSKQSQMKEIHIISKQDDRNSSKDPDTINHHISSSSSDSEISPNGHSRKVVKKSSSEIRRWTIFGTWSSSSSSNLLESIGDGENSKTVNEDDAQKLKSNLPSSSIGSSKSEPNNDTTKNSSTKKDSQNSESSHNSKMNDKPQRSRKRSSNPIIETLPGNSSSWCYDTTY